MILECQVGVGALQTDPLGWNADYTSYQLRDPGWSDDLSEFVFSSGMVVRIKLINSGKTGLCLAYTKCSATIRIIIIPVTTTAISKDSKLEAVRCNAQNRLLLQAGCKSWLYYLLAVWLYKVP